MTRRIAVLIASLLAMAMTAAGIQLLAPERDTYTLTADVVQAPNLFEGGRVMVRGVQVGEITSVVPNENSVRLTLEVDSDVEVPADANLAVIPITVISDRYVQLMPAYDGSGPLMQDSDHIPLARTSIPAELDEVLAELKGLLGALEPRPGERNGPLARLVTALDQGLKGRSDDLKGTLAGSATVLSNLAGSQSQIVGLVRNLDQLFLALADRSTELMQVNERFAVVAESLVADQANLEGTIENLALLADETAGLLERSGDDLGSSFGRLGHVLGRVLEHESELQRAMRWTNVISEALGATDASGRGRFAYSGRQAAPGTPESSYNYRLETRDTIACERIERVMGVVEVFTPNPTVDDVMVSLLSYIPEEYHEHLDFLLRQLVDLCTDALPAPPLSESQALRVQALVDELGREEVLRLVARYLVEGVGL